MAKLLKEAESSPEPLTTGTGIDDGMTLLAVFPPVPAPAGVPLLGANVEGVVAGADDEEVEVAEGLVTLGATTVGGIFPVLKKV